MKKKSNKTLTKQEALSKLEHYCVYQDRCHSEVRNKLLELAVYGDELEEIIACLVQENFLNEERFARTFARGKFNIKEWGRLKIKQHLKQKYVSDYCIIKAMEEIDEADYAKTLKRVLAKRLRESPKANSYQNWVYLSKYALKRGFEYDLIKESLSTMNLEEGIG